jgi:hypothetical protein
MAATITRAWDETIGAEVGIGYAVLHRDHVYKCLKCAGRLKVFDRGHDGHPEHLEHRKHNPQCEDCCATGAYSRGRKAPATVNPGE